MTKKQMNKIADEIARNSGVQSNSPYRIKSGILYTLMQSVINGHTYLPKNELVERSANILNTVIDEPDELLMDMIINRKIIIRKVNDIDVNYRIVERRDGDVAACYADSNKAYNELGWKAELSLEDMVSSAYKFAINNKK